MNCATSRETTASTRHHLKPLSSPERDVQIWIAHLDSISSKEAEHLFHSLDPSERSRTEKFRSEQDRHRYMAAHGLLRFILAKTLGRAANTIVLEESPQGKPKLHQNQNERLLKFNLSHAAGWALIAVAWDRELGVDLESAESLPQDEKSLSKVAARVLSNREFDAWNAISNPAKRREAFLRTWTRKEAYVKATGEGLRHELADIDLPPRAAQFDQWIVHNLSVPDELTAALAVEAC